MCSKGLISVSPFDTVKLLTIPDSGIFGVLLFFPHSCRSLFPSFFPVLPTSVSPLLWVFGFGNSSAVAPVYSSAHSKLRSHYSTDRHYFVVVGFSLSLCSGVFRCSLQFCALSRWSRNTFLNTTHTYKDISMRSHKHTLTSEWNEHSWIETVWSAQCVEGLCSLLLY